MLVVNIHAINFTFGIVAFGEQLERIRPLLAAHPGPMILSGDFNTWRRRRSDILDAFANDFNLTPVEFDDDHRKMFFGQPLDHIYVRGLRIGESDTRQLNSSDHNPLLVEFRL
jgi:endonuclease/exonuclease/phosphatase (EEP) superfamily protein YafD